LSCCGGCGAGVARISHFACRIDVAPIKRLTAHVSAWFVAARANCIHRAAAGTDVSESIHGAAAVSGTVARTVRVLRFIAERQSTTIREASAELKLAPSTVHRLFELLAGEGVIEQNKSDRSYRVGPELFRISAQVVGRYDLRTIALPFMREVVAACEETCVLGLYLPAVHRMTLAERVDSTILLRYQLPMNTHLSLLSGASGRSILAFLPDDQVDVIIQAAKAERSGGKPVSALKVHRELKTIQKQGFAISRGEMIAGAMAIAVPVIGAEGTAIASIGVTAPNDRMQRAGVQRVSALLLDKARQLSVRLGAPSPQGMSAVQIAPAARSRGAAKRPRRAA
jgi:IclR family acetate operon transcriptional repressor